jgi:hypothetical protein
MSSDSWFSESPKEKQGTHDSSQDGVRSREVLESFTWRQTMGWKAAMLGRGLCQFLCRALKATDSMEDDVRLYGFNGESEILLATTRDVHFFHRLPDEGARLKAGRVTCCASTSRR